MGLVKALVFADKKLVVPAFVGPEAVASSVLACTKLEDMVPAAFASGGTADPAAVESADPAGVESAGVADWVTAVSDDKMAADRAVVAASAEQTAEASADQPVAAQHHSGPECEPQGSGPAWA